MGTFYEEEALQVELHAAEQYPTEKEALRAMTVAGFRIIQNSRQLDKRAMRTDVFRFLLSPRALSYWKEKGLLEPRGRTEVVRLTDEGLSVCSGSLHEEVVTSTRESAITQWETLMISGGALTSKSKVFSLPLSRT
ncbi:hypothetical protein KDX31_03760 [Amphritea atlantica]|uniref:Winged helix DNA-binding domain-containing protein n=1 Tax=Amphritea atlantica TaxID=355243 RepID=A0ABY5GXH5_9GAMM|nr:hypothetical protein KDX31_03760 [Amphritea atlantica]